MWKLFGKTMLKEKMRKKTIKLNKKSKMKQNKDFRGV